MPSASQEDWPEDEAPLAPGEDFTLLQSHGQEMKSLTLKSQDSNVYEDVDDISSDGGSSLHDFYSDCLDQTLENEVDDNDERGTNPHCVIGWPPTPGSLYALIPRTLCPPPPPSITQLDFPRCFPFHFPF